MSRSKRTGESPKLTLVSGSGGVAKNGAVSTPFGPLKVGLITSQKTNKEAQLTELLSSLEKQVATLESKYYEVCDTLISVTQHLVKLSAFTNDTTSTDVVV